MMNELSIVRFRHIDDNFLLFSAFFYLVKFERNLNGRTQTVFHTLLLQSVLSSLLAN